MLVLWDLNGTALDDFDIWYQSVRRVFAKFDASPPTIEEYFADLESEHFLDVYRKRGINASEEELNAIYIEAYRRRIFEVHLNLEFLAAVLCLAEARHTQGVVSSQIPELVDPLRQHLDLDRLPIAFWEYPVFSKATKFAELLETTKTPPEKALYVGDAPSDTRHAKKAGIIAVTYLNGYLPTGLFSPNSTDHFVRSLREVVNIVKSTER